MCSSAELLPEPTSSSNSRMRACGPFCCSARSFSMSASSASFWLATLMYSPAAMLSAPENNPATPASCRGEGEEGSRGESIQESPGAWVTAFVTSCGRACDSSAGCPRQQAAAHRMHQSVCCSHAGRANSGWLARVSTVGRGGRVSTAPSHARCMSRHFAPASHAGCRLQRQHPTSGKLLRRGRH